MKPGYTVTGWINSDGKESMEGDIADVYHMIQLSPARAYFEMNHPEYSRILAFFMVLPKLDRGVVRANCILFRMYTDRALIASYVEEMNNPNTQWVRDDELIDYYNNRRKPYKLPWFKGFEDSFYKTVNDAEIQHMTTQTGYVLSKKFHELDYRSTRNERFDEAWFDSDQLMRYAKDYFDRVVEYIRDIYDTKIRTLSETRPNTLGDSPFAKKSIDMRGDEQKVTTTPAATARQSATVLLEIEKDNLLTKCNNAWNALSIEGYSLGEKALIALSPAILIIILLFFVGGIVKFAHWIKKR